MDIVDQEREVEDLNASTPDLSLRKTVTLTDVHFNYPQRPDVHVLKGLNLRIDAGDPNVFVLWSARVARAKAPWPPSFFASTSRTPASCGSETCPPATSTCAGTDSAWRLFPTGGDLVWRRLANLVNP